MLTLSSGTHVAFLIFALMAITGAVLMITFTRVVTMVIAAALTFISLAGLYVLLDAEFVAFVQVLIYAGAISILMIFGIMMTKHDSEEASEPQPLAQRISVVAGSLALFGTLFWIIQKAKFPAGQFVPEPDNTMAIGRLLFNDYAIPFEIMSVLLTVAFIGAIVIAKREEE